ncbi:argininosuccinate lyase [mine drainage metagenome]|uniref:Argininosuccinate lyase n=1 Tax=mine drainage metagenome TaxID=410659 RepID=T1BW49_9ZZZZ
MAAEPSGAPPAYVLTPVAPFLNSLAVDRALARYDLAGSVAHAEMLGGVGLLSPTETAQLVSGLRRVAQEVADGRFRWRPELEDVHTNVEVRLTELVGAVGGKLHTARSRNDQVALDERLYLRAAVSSVAHPLLDLQAALVDRAAALREIPMPGYTHLQRAQPVTVGHLLLAHFWRLDRDLDRLFATATRANVSPLGAGALAGSTLGIDPAAVARALAFDRPFENSLDAVSDRDFLVELVFDLALLGVHASAFGEEIVLFASKEFGFLERTPSLGSGSSLMPQKRNPDAAELVRGKAGRVVGDLVALLTTLKGLPLAYDRDLQEDKAPVAGRGSPPRPRWSRPSARWSPPSPSSRPGSRPRPPTPSSSRPTSRSSSCGPARRSARPTKRSGRTYGRTGAPSPRRSSPTCPAALSIPPGPSTRGPRSPAAPPRAARHRPRSNGRSRPPAPGSPAGPHPCPRSTERSRLSRNS